MHNFNQKTLARESMKLAESGKFCNEAARFLKT
jgi:hypothetical protein